MSPDVGTRVNSALELEQLSFAKAAEEINAETNTTKDAVVAQLAAKNQLGSGMFGSKIWDIYEARARRLIAKHIELRRQTIARVPEVATETLFREFTTALEKTVEVAIASISDHIRLRAGASNAASQTTDRRKENAVSSLKAFARREVQIMKTEFELQREPAAVVLKPSRAKDARKVWVVHGRNLKARDAMFTFLRSIDLDPMEWDQARALTGKATPYNGEVLDLAFEEAQAVVVLVTGDDVARLGTRYAGPGDSSEETDLTPQARPNVLFEAGMAFGRHPERTILAHFGKTRSFSDVAGRNVVRINNSTQGRQGLADRLRTSGCAVQTDNRTTWHTAGDFDAAVETPDLSTEPKLGRHSEET